MKPHELFRQLEADTENLRRISETYASGSPEAETLRRAALALVYVAENAQTEFAKFVAEIDSELTDAERAELRDRYGLDE